MDMWRHICEWLTVKDQVAFSGIAKWAADCGQSLANRECRVDLTSPWAPLELAHLVRHSRPAEKLETLRLKLNFDGTRENMKPAFATASEILSSQMPSFFALKIQIECHVSEFMSAMINCTSTLYKPFLAIRDRLQQGSTCAVYVNKQLILFL